MIPLPYAWFFCSGTVQYGPDACVSFNLEADFVPYYRSLIPKCIPLHPQTYRSRISVIRKHESPTKMGAWERHLGKNFDIYYENHIRYEKPFFYMDIHSSRFATLREELGLPHCDELSLGAKRGHYCLILARKA
jgi:hypothetical protein